MKTIFTILGSLLLGAAFFLLIGWTTMTLWNLLLPSICGFSYINFWQAMGLLLLCRILFGGFGSGGWRNSNWQRKKDNWKQKMQEKWSEMSEEEKSDWKNRLSKHCSNTAKKEDSIVQLPEKE